MQTTCIGAHNSGEEQYAELMLYVRPKQQPHQAAACVSMWAEHGENNTRLLDHASSPQKQSTRDVKDRIVSGHRPGLSILVKTSKTWSSNQSTCMATACSGQQSCCRWAARYDTWIVIELMPRGVLFSFLFFFCCLAL